MDFKFFHRAKEYTINIDYIPYYKVYAYQEITQDIIDKLNLLVSEFLFERDTTENRNVLMIVMSKYFFKIESIYNETI